MRILITFTEPDLKFSLIRHCNSRSTICSSYSAGIYTRDWYFFISGINLKNYTKRYVRHEKMGRELGHGIAETFLETGKQRVGLSSSFL